MTSTPLPAPPVTSTPSPSDLVPIRDATRMVGRGLSTLRGWCASGELTAHYGSGSHPNNRPVLVSRAELQILAATTKSPNPGRPAPVSATVPVAVDRAELVAAWAERDLARAELAGSRDLVDALKLAQRATEDRARDLATALDVERARVTGLTAENEALRGDAGVPWWRRLLGVSSTPRLSGAGEA